MNEEKLMVSLLMKKYFEEGQDIKSTLADAFSKVDKMDLIIEESDNFFQKVCNIQTKLIILTNIMLSKKTLDNKKDYEYIIEKFEDIIKEFKSYYEEEMKNGSNK